MALPCGCQRKAASPLRVVATTTHLGALVQELGGSTVHVQVLTPPGSCPGHYDLKPGDVRAMARSGVVFAHGYEKQVMRMAESLGRKRVRVCMVDVKGNWLLPQVQDRAALVAARLLSEVDAANEPVHRKRLKQFRARLRLVAADVRRSLDAARVNGTTVICSDQQAPLLKWMGLEVVATYGRPEELTPQALHELVRLGRHERARLVVDNLQSGPKAGAQLAEEIGAAHVTLSNFPGGFPDTRDWEKCLRDNARRVTEALGSARVAGRRSGVRG